MISASSDQGIRARALTKRYGATTAVDDLTFTARPGVITGFLGPNGAGKSTTLQMLLGLVRPTAGRITVNGRSINELANPARTVGAMLDARAVHPRRRAIDHLRSYAYASGLDTRRAEEVLDLVGLASVARGQVGDFSLGMCQRLGIATALLGDPDVIVLDEPLNGLDPAGIRWLRMLLRDLASQKRTVLFSSHLMSEMELTADHLVVIGRGRLIAESALGEFVAERTRETVRVRTADPGRLFTALVRAGGRLEEERGETAMITGLDPIAIGRIAAGQGIALGELTVLRDSLEDVFLRLTADDAEYSGSVA